MEKLRHLGFFQEAERETQTALQIHSHFSRVQLADIDVPCTNYSCRSLHSLRAKAGTVTWEAVSKLTFWVQLFPLNVTGLRCVWGKKNNWKHVMFPLLMWRKLSNWAVYIFVGDCFRVCCLFPSPGQAGATLSSQWRRSHSEHKLLIV